MDKILVVDDDKEIRNILGIYLRNNNFEVIYAENGIEALEKINDSIDLVILDIMMPEMDGYETLNKMREEYTTPVIFLSAKGADIDRINGIMTGADDYIVKPFNPMELVVRVQANIRRYKVLGGKKIEIKEEENKTIIVEDMEIDLEAHVVYKKGVQLKLTKTEFKILALLIQNRGIVYNPETIQDQIWNDPSAFVASNSIAVHIGNLRNKIEDNPKKPKIIINIWGVGYKIEK